MMAGSIISKLVLDKGNAMPQRLLPYRSQRRDAARTIQAGSFPWLEGQRPPPPQGVFLYYESGPRFSRIFRDRQRLSRKALHKNLGHHPRSVANSIDDLYFLTSRYLRPINFDPYAVVNPKQDVLLPCLHKSLFSLFTSYHSTMDGLWGPARLHLRLVYESLLIAKFCSLNADSDVFDRWVDGVEIYFTNAVLKKIRTSRIDALRDLWATLSDWSHSTIYAGQPISPIEEDVEEVRINFALFYVFIAWTWHLLMRHIATPSVRYYGDRIIPRERVRMVNRRMRRALDKQYSGLPNDSKRLILAYRATWKTVST